MSFLALFVIDGILKAEYGQMSTLIVLWCCDRLFCVDQFQCNQEKKGLGHKNSLFIIFLAYITCYSFWPYGDTNFWGNVKVMFALLYTMRKLPRWCDYSIIDYYFYPILYDNLLTWKECQSQILLLLLISNLQM